MKILLGDLNAEVCREGIFQPTNGNRRLHEISNDNGVRIVNFATFKISQSQVQCNSKNILGLSQMRKPTIRLTIF
jgi:hypothetical protein